MTAALAAFAATADSPSRLSVGALLGAPNPTGSSSRAQVATG
jgi:hypothetical protein